MLSHSFVNQFPLHFGITIDAHLLLRRTGPFWRGEIIAYQQSHAQHIVVCVCVWGGGLFTARPSFAWLRQDRTRKDPILGTLKSLGTKNCYGHRSTSCHFQQRAPLRYTSRTRTMLAVLWNYPARIVTECLAFGTVTSTAVSPFADWDNQGILDNRECTF